MNGDINKYLPDLGQAIAQTDVVYIPPTKREQLMKARSEFDKRIVDIDDALQLLNENPEIEKLINALQKVGL